MGTLFQTVPHMESLVASLRRELPDTRCLYDMNLREDHWSLSLVERLCERVNVLKLNRSEAVRLAELGGIRPGHFTLDRFCKAWSVRFGIDVICITLGSEGCCIFAAGELQRFPGYEIEVLDTVGAGDAFAAGFFHGLHHHWSLRACAGFANRLGAFVASRPGAIPTWTKEELAEAVPEDRKGREHRSP